MLINAYMCWVDFTLRLVSPALWHLHCILYLLISSPPCVREQLKVDLEDKGCAMSCMRLGPKGLRVEVEREGSI